MCVCVCVEALSGFCLQRKQGSIDSFHSVALTPNTNLGQMEKSLGRPLDFCPKSVCVCNAFFEVLCCVSRGVQYVTECYVCMREGTHAYSCFCVCV